MRAIASQREKGREMNEKALANYQDTGAIVNLVLDEQIFMTTLYGIVLLVLGILIQNMIGRHAKIT